MIKCNTLLQRTLTKRSCRLSTAYIPDVSTDITIVGGGVVGTACAAHLSHLDHAVTLVEKESSLGYHASARNSGVIHAGLYYPKDSLKTMLCIRGKLLLYELIRMFNIPHNPCGKWIVTPPSMESKLTKLYDHARSLNIPIHWVHDARRLQPNLSPSISNLVLNSPSSGVVDPVALIQCLQNLAQDNDVSISTNSRVNNISVLSANSNGFRHGYRYVLDMKSPNDHAWTLATKYIINCAGTWADSIYRQAYLNTTNERKPQDDKHHPLHLKTWPTRGHYYTLKRNTVHQLNHRLIYPIPDNSLGISLGIHTTFDMDGSVKFGPSVDWNDAQQTKWHKGREDYTPPDPQQESELKTQFHTCISTYLQGIPMNDLQYDSCGIRSKISGPNTTASDFLVHRGDHVGLPQWVNCVGIESPGLTSSLAIAEYVAKNMMGLHVPNWLSL